MNYFRICRFYFLFFLLVPFSLSIYGQNGGDAGIGLNYILGVENKDTSNKLNLAAIYNNGRESLISDDNSRNAYTLVFSHQKKVGKNTTWNNRISLASISGQLANNLNLGDIYSSVYTKIIGSNSGFFKIHAMVGLKVPLTNSNDKAGKVNLPMRYQTSLGTFDIMSGINSSILKGNIFIGIQHPILSVNRNQFYGYLFPLDEYESSALLKRGTDIYCSVKWDFSFWNGKIQIAPQAEMLQRINSDKVQSSDQSSFINADRHNYGLTGSGIININYRLKSAQFVRFFLGKSIVKKRVDGLDRNISAGIQFFFK